MWWRFPYTNFHEMNLDWILQKIKDFSNDIENVNNTIIQQVDDTINDLVESGYFDDLIDNDLLNGLQTQIDLLTKKNVIMLGDSYGTYEDSWNVRLENIINPDVCYKFSLGGCGFGKKDIDGNTPTKLLSDNSGKVSNKLKINMIIVAMGANDIVFPDDISQGFEDFRTYCNQNYPNATIYIAAIGNTLGTRSGNSFSAATPANYYKMVTTYQNMGRYHNCRYLRFSEMSLINPNHFQSDGIHPNSDGSANIATMLFRALTGSEHVSLVQSIQLKSANNIWSPASGITADMNINLKIDNGVITATTNKANIQFPAVNSNLFNINVNLGTLKHPLMKGILEGQKSILVPCYLSGLASGTNLVTARLYMKGEELHVVASHTGTGTTTGAVSYTQGFGTFNYLT